DITSPGSPSSPYHDKGVFMLWRLDTLLTRDTQAVAGFSLSPWTRDVGQMVASPGDLYSLLEDPVYRMHSRDGLSRFGDRDDDYDLPSLGTGRDRIWPDLVADDFFSGLRAASEVDWPRPSDGRGRPERLPRRQPGRPLPFLPVAPCGDHVGGGHAVRKGVRHGVALRRRRAHQRRAHRQPRALALRYRRRRRARLCHRQP